MKFILKQAGLDAEVIEQDKIGLATLQHYCEGYVTTAHVPELAEVGVTVWANDEGILMGMAPNLGHVLEGFGGKHPQVLFGPVVFTSSNREGETTGLNERQEAAVKAFTARASADLTTVLLLARMPGKFTR